MTGNMMVLAVGRDNAYMHEEVAMCTCAASRIREFESNSGS